MRPYKKYDIISLLLIMITLMMFLLATNLFLVNRNLITANAYSNKSVNVENSQYQDFRKKIFIYMFNKSITVMDLNNEDTNNIFNIAKSIFNDSFNFNYKDPKNYLNAQLPMFKEVENNSKIVSEYSIIDEDYDTRRIYVAEQGNKDSNNNEKKINESNNNTNNSNYEVIVKEESEAEDSYEVINIDGENGSSDDIEIVSTPVPAPAKIVHDIDEPLIFIYQTHGTESYKPESVGNYHSLNRQFTVIKVAEELTKVLESKGYKVIHDDTLHDYPSYEGSYSRSLQTLNKNLSNTKSLKIVFDIHRDGINNIDSLENHDELRNNSVIKINGEKLAKYSLVVGEANENVTQLKRYLYYLKSVSDELYPGLCSGIISKDFKYNQYKSDYYALIEIGSNANTIEESMNTGKYLGEIISKALNGFVEKK